MTYGVCTCEIYIDYIGLKYYPLGIMKFRVNLGLHTEYMKY